MEFWVRLTFNGSPVIVAFQVMRGPTWGRGRQHPGQGVTEAPLSLESLRAVIQGDEGLGWWRSQARTPRSQKEGRGAASSSLLSQLRSEQSKLRASY